MDSTSRHGKEIQFSRGDGLSLTPISTGPCDVSDGRNERSVNTQTKLGAIASCFLFRLATALAIVILFAVLARAGGPKYVTGSSFFTSSTMGQPVNWPLGHVTY